MVSILPFFLLLIFPLLGLVGLHRGDAWLWAPPVFAFFLLPILDFLAGETRDRIVTTDSGLKLADLLFWIYVPLQLAMLAFGIWRAPDLPVWLAALTTGAVTGGIGITLAHELVHRREKSLYALGMTLLASVSYGHFAVEHVLGHHSNVATADDPASARRGESAWRFVPRSVVGSFKSAWRIELVRLKRLGKPAFTPTNRLLQTWSVTALIALTSFLISGPRGLAFFIAQSMVAILLLELANYVEHYGLTRRILANGKPEPTQLWHSWDSHSRLSGWFLIHLSRHADHHKYPARPFTKLEGSLQSPLLPAGYPASVLLATLPPLWYLVMHPRLDRFKEHHENLDTHRTLI